MNIQDEYIHSAPHPQNAIDIFQGEWSSKLPPPYDNLSAGQAALFEDPRVDWAINALGGVDQHNVLELGPLEGGHSFMLERRGVSRITAIEANTRSYLKCLIVKELLSLNQVDFLLGDFLVYLRDTEQRYDLCFASGVLYHMTNPMELIDLISKVSARIFVWTHYFDKDLVESNPPVRKKFSSQTNEEYDGNSYTLHWHEYQDALDWGGFCGGSKPRSAWMEREDILKCLDHFGFGNIEIGFDEPSHVNGPAFALVGTRI